VFRAFEVGLFIKRRENIAECGYRKDVKISTQFLKNFRFSNVNQSCVLVDSELKLITSKSRFTHG
jgi:glutaredoxin-related protein